MAPIKLQTTTLSWNSLRPELALVEKGIEYEVVPADILTGSHKNADFLAASPFGNIPVLYLEDGTAVYESRAIARVICEQYRGSGPDLAPEYAKGLKAFAAFEQALAVETMKFDPYANQLVWQKLLAPARGIPQDAAAIARCQKFLSTNFAALDTILGKQKFMAGDSFTLADINHMPNVHMLFVAGEGGLLEDKSNVMRWWNDVTERDAWKKLSKAMNEALQKAMEAASAGGA